MRIVVITSCTGEKHHKLETQLTRRDFERLQDVEWFAAREAELDEFRLDAGRMYTGQQHLRLMRGVKTAREKLGAESVDLWILSAGYGLIPAGREIVPYECTFQGMRKPEIKKWAGHLRVPEAAREVLKEQYDLGLILLGDDYLEACQLHHGVELGGPTLAFVGARQLKKLTGIPNLKLCKVSNAEAKRFSCGLVALKGELGARILSQAAEHPALIKTSVSDKSDVLSLLDKDESPPAQRRQAARPNPNVDTVISIPKSWWEKPHREKLMYFIPEWDDLVDPDYDFETDTHSGGAGDWSNEVYAHQIYPEPNYDGILISKVVAEKSKKKKARINEMGVHRYLRVPREFPIMGDCGAFGYIKEDIPPYSTNEILDYYTRLDFDFGVSVDHLIVTSTESQKKQRYDLTINNAEEFLVEHKKRSLKWTPVGAVQGWDPASYAEAARQYVAMGYQYIGLGGLVRTSTPEILTILEEARRRVPPKVKIHLFGLARLRVLNRFAELGVRSVDSASYLRRAWLGTGQNYLSLDAKVYAAIRVPEGGKSFRAKRMVAEGRADEIKATQLEQQCRRALREFDSGNLSVEATLDALEEYDQLITTTRQDTRPLLRAILEDRPWKSCPCRICRTDGIDVAIFRGNNRNRRRGFHNTYVFYRLLQRGLEGEDVAIEPQRSDGQLPLFEPIEAHS